MHLSEKDRRTSGGLALGALHALHSQSFGGLHQQHAHAVEEHRTHDEGDEELGQVGGQSGGVDAGHSQVGKAHVVQHLGCVGVQDDEDEQHHGQRDEEAEEITQNRGQGCDGQQRDHSEDKAHKAAQLHRDEAVFHIALQREHHDVAQKDQPAVLHACDMDNGVGDEDPHQQHQAEVQQEALGNGFVHG